LIIAIKIISVLATLILNHYTVSYITY